MSDATADSGVITSRGEPLDEAVLTALEDELSVRLPNDYREFMLDGDGADFRSDNVVDGTDLGAIVGIVPMADGSVGDETLPDMRRTFARRVPADFLPIASDWGGNLYCLGIRGEHLGQVFFWNHEEESDDGEEATMANMELVASTFREFLDRLRADDD